MNILSTVADARQYRGCELIPTMGALHKGHCALIDAARRRVREEPKRSGRSIVVSIFVNQKQFAPDADFDRYPRNLDRDISLCREQGVDAVFAPSAEEMYPPGFSTSVSISSLSELMCGITRPEHFTGVATVLARLFGIFRPERAYFGWKDAQQLIIIRRMVIDLQQGIDIVPIETVREHDGLACSSRNTYLSPAERGSAKELYKALKKGEAAALEGARPDEIVTRVRRHLSVSGLEEEYVDLRNMPELTLASFKTLPRKSSLENNPDDIFSSIFSGFLLAAAVRIGKTRLIDNVRL